MSNIKSLRGGSRISIPRACRSACRNGLLPDNRIMSIGFRIVCKVYQ